MKKSAKITQIIVRIGYLGLTASLFVFPYMLHSISSGFGTAPNNIWLLVPFYFVVPAGYAALVCIDKIMKNVINENIFDNQITKLLKIISWCCIYAGVVGMLSFLIVFVLHEYMMIYVLLLAFGEMFMALICHVLKSCFESGNALKQENDLTI